MQSTGGRRHRLQVSPLRRFAYLCAAVAVVLVAVAVVVGQLLFLQVAAVAAVVLGLVALVCSIDDAIDARRSAFAEASDAAAAYNRRFAAAGADHARELAIVIARSDDVRQQLCRAQQHIDDLTARLTEAQARQAAEAADQQASAVYAVDATDQPVDGSTDVDPAGASRTGVEEAEPAPTGGRHRRRTPVVTEAPRYDQDDLPTVVDLPVYRQVAFERAAQAAADT